MRTRIGSFAGGHWRPGLVPALVKVAMISAWKGRTFLDDDDDLADVADFVADEAAPAVTLTRPVEPIGDAGHSVAA